MAEVMCAHCKPQDSTCTRLFCAPDRLIVNITMTMMETFCNSLRTLFPECHSEYCPSMIVRRSVDKLMSEGKRQSGGCHAHPDWATADGLDQWCLLNCKHGIDYVTCPATYCVCPTETTESPQSGSILDGTCIRWTASLVFQAVKGMDDWCNSVCSLGGDCPQSHCACAETVQPSTTSSDTTLPTPKTSTTTTAPTTAAKITNASSPQTTTTNVPSTTTQNLPSTTNIASTNYTANFSDQESLSVVSAVVCDHSTKLDQNVLANRYCPLAGTTPVSGYSQDLIDQVMSFAPKLLCSFSKVSRTSQQCPNMFCGEGPLAQGLLYASLCSVCTMFSDQLGSSCSSAYC